MRKLPAKGMALHGEGKDCELPPSWSFWEGVVGRAFLASLPKAQVLGESRDACLCWQPRVQRSAFASLQGAYKALV